MPLPVSSLFSFQITLVKQFLSNMAPTTSLPSSGHLPWFHAGYVTKCTLLGLASLVQTLPLYTSFISTKLNLLCLYFKFPARPLHLTHHTPPPRLHPSILPGILRSLRFPFPLDGSYLCIRLSSGLGYKCFKARIHNFSSAQSCVSCAPGSGRYA